MRWKRKTQTQVGWTRQLGKAAILGEEATLSKNLKTPKSDDTANLARVENRLSPYQR